ncbi:MAG TPA: hypothetical protein VJ508_06255, partial [Saprospiraceae bacterium]|nr:hypothetical protein [Saprospiraceae bacterium]
MRYSFNEIRRQSHNKRADPKSLRRMALMVLLIAACIFYFIYKMGQVPKSMTPAIRPYTKYEPEAVHGKIYHKPYFSLSYVGQYELPEWVTYELTVDMLNHKKFERNQEFIPDPEI